MNKQDIRFNEDTEKFGGQYPQGFMQALGLTSDANLAQEIGQYGTDTATLNLPPGHETDGTLLVQSNAAIGSQIYIPHDHNSAAQGVWVRAWQNDTAWLAWERLGGEPLDAEDFAVKVSSELDDCNNAVTQGMYYTTDATVNIPIAGQWGGLIVSGDGSSAGVIVQIHTNQLGNAIHYRACNADVWSSWIKLGAGGGTSIPVGGIIMYSGPFTGIPGDWALCDGNNGTPNLTASNIVATSAGTPSGTVTTTVNADGVDPTNGNMPPYYTLAYIIKIA